MAKSRNNRLIQLRLIKTLKDRNEYGYPEFSYPVGSIIECDKDYAKQLVDQGIGEYLEDDEG